MRFFYKVFSSNVHLIDNGPFSSIQGMLLSATSFCASLLQAFNGVMSMALGSASSSSTLWLNGEDLLILPMQLGKYPLLELFWFQTTQGSFIYMTRSRWVSHVCFLCLSQRQFVQSRLPAMLADKIGAKRGLSQDWTLLASECQTPLAILHRCCG